MANYICYVLHGERYYLARDIKGSYFFVSKMENAMTYFPEYESYTDIIYDALPILPSLGEDYEEGYFYLVMPVLKMKKVQIKKTKNFLIIS